MVPGTIRQIARTRFRSGIAAALWAGVNAVRKVLGAVAVTVAVVVAIEPATVDAATITGEYTPGVTGAELGGRLTVNGYGVAGVGAHRFALDGGGSALGVCIQAHVSHSTSADYRVSDPVLVNGALDYLTWRHLSGGGLSDVDAAGLAVAVWGVTGAQRSDGGTVVTTGDIRVAVDGARRGDIEAAARRFVNEGIRRRGPWTLGDVTVVDGRASVRLDGPGGPISGRPVTFRVTGSDGTVVWEAVAATGDAGVATVDVAAAGDAADPAADRLTASTSAPGRAIELSAPGSQRFALAGTPIELIATPDVGPAATSTSVAPTPTTGSTTEPSNPPTTPATAPVPSTATGAPPSTEPAPSTASTTTTTSTSTSTSTSTTTPAPPTTATSTISTTTEPPTSAPPPDVDTSPPGGGTSPPAVATTGPPASGTTGAPAPTPTMAVTGGTTRAVVRAGAALFALGSLATLAAAGSRHQRRVEERSG